MTSTSSLRAVLLYHRRPQTRSPEMHTKPIVHGVLADGTEHVVSYGGTGQYSSDRMGASACGLTALNFAKVAFSIEQGSLQDAALLQAVLARECSKVQASYNPLPKHSLISPGNHRYMRITTR